MKFRQIQANKGMQPQRAKGQHWATKKLLFFHIFDWFSPWPLIRAKPFRSHSKAIPKPFRAILAKFSCLCQRFASENGKNIVFFDVFDWFRPLIRAKPFQSHSKAIPKPFRAILAKFSCLCQRFASGNGKKIVFLDVFDWFSPWPLIRAKPFLKNGFQWFQNGFPEWQKNGTRMEMQHVWIWFYQIWNHKVGIPWVSQHCGSNQGATSGARC